MPQRKNQANRRITFALLHAAVAWTALAGSAASAQTATPAPSSDSATSAAVPETKPAESGTATAATPMDAPAADAGSTGVAGAAGADADAADAAAKPISYAAQSRAYGTKRETEPPKYAQPLSKRKLPGYEDVDWLDFGLSTRMRYEYRDDDVRRSERVLDDPFLLKSNLYLGVREIADPFRFGLELQDSRIDHSEFPDTNREADEHDIIQAFGELYFRDALGPDRPLRFQAGRLAFEYLDRRLISRNPWRNTTNNFDGFRFILGQETNDWQLDIIAVQPVERRLTRLDVPDEERWFYGVIGSWRRWSKVITLEPYYLVLDEDRKGAPIDRELHTLGLRGFGLFGKSGFDYDFDVIWQFGKSGDREHRAFAATGEVGYTFEHKWKPRLSTFAGYASGDRNPTDNVNERFDRLFGFARPWSANDYIVFENVITPKLRLELQPHKNVTMDAGYSAYWLASDSDSWSNAGLRDTAGHSGDFMGQEFDTRVRWKVNPNAELIVGYAHFIPGDFTENTSDADDTDFMYVEMTLSF